MVSPSATNFNHPRRGYPNYSLFTNYSLFIIHYSFFTKKSFRPALGRKPSLPWYHPHSIPQNRTLGAVTRTTRRGLAGAPGRTKRCRRRGLTAADPHSLCVEICAIFPITAGLDYHSSHNFSRGFLYFLPDPPAQTQKKKLTGQSAGIIMSP